MDRELVEPEGDRPHHSAMRTLASPEAGITNDLSAEWAARALESELFWASTPEWSPMTARGTIDGETFLWAGNRILGVPLVAAVVSDHLDGMTPLIDIAEDLAVAADSSLAWARDAVATSMTSLAAAGAIDGVPLPSSIQAAAVNHRDTPGGLEYAVPSTSASPSDDEVIRTVTEPTGSGAAMTTEYLADGRQRVSSSITFTSGGVDAVADQMLNGDRSPAELVPLDSCLGSKLRNSDDVPLISFRCRDGKIRSVRCQSGEVADALRTLGSERTITSGERGPVVAFVVAPLEGSGPLRVYDGRGQRHGRARTVREVAQLVDGLLGTQRTADSPPSVDMPLPLTLVKLVRGSDAVMVPVAELADPTSRRALRSRGWEVTWVSVAIDPDGTLVPLTELSGPGHPPTDGVERLPIVFKKPPQPAELLSVVGLPDTDEPIVRHALFTRACAFAAGAMFAAEQAHLRRHHLVLRGPHAP